MADSGTKRKPPTVSPSERIDLKRVSLDTHTVTDDTDTNNTTDRTTNQDESEYEDVDVIEITTGGCHTPPYYKSIEISRHPSVANQFVVSGDTYLIREHLKACHEATSVVYNRTEKEWVITAPSLCLGELGDIIQAFVTQVKKRGGGGSNNNNPRTPRPKKVTH